MCDQSIADAIHKLEECIRINRIKRDGKVGPRCRNNRIRNTVLNVLDILKANAETKDTPT